MQNAADLAHLPKKAPEGAFFRNLVKRRLLSGVTGCYLGDIVISIDRKPVTVGLGQVMPGIDHVGCVIEFFKNGVSYVALLVDKENIQDLIHTPLECL